MPGWPVVAHSASLAASECWDVKCTVRNDKASGDASEAILGAYAENRSQ